MKALFRNIFVFTIGLVFFQQDAKAENFNRLCVLSFDVKQSTISNGVYKIFKDTPDTRLILEATPKDFIKCVKDDFEEIVFVAHALFMDKTNENVNLGYFTAMDNEEKKQYLANAEAYIVQKLELSQNKFVYGSRRRHGMGTATEVNKTKLKLILERLQNWPADQPLYGGPKVIFSRFFETVEKEIQKKHDQGDLKLKKIRIMSCAREQILRRYPFFLNLAQYGVQLDAAPSNNFFSWLTGREVTNFNTDWFKESY